MTELLRQVAGRVRYFFANEYSVCSSCGKEIWFDDTVCIDQAGTGLRHEDCAEEVVPDARKNQ